MGYKSGKTEYNEELLLGLSVCFLWLPELKTYSSLHVCLPHCEKCRYALFNIFFLRWIRHLLYSITSQLSELTPAALWAALCLYHSLSLQNLLNVGLTSREICFWRVLADGSWRTILKLLNLNLSGPWRQPEVSLLRIFSDRETLQKSTLIQ